MSETLQSILSLILLFLSKLRQEPVQFRFFAVKNDLHWDFNGHARKEPLIPTLSGIFPAAKTTAGTQTLSVRES